MVACFQLLVVVTALTLISTSHSAVAPNITDYLSELPPFLGADVATSIPFSFSNGSLSLWLFGDTITGSFSAGHRTIASMPRNSVGLFHTNKGVPQSSFSHSIRHATHPAEFKHVGFWSPDEDSHWLLPHPAKTLHFRQPAAIMSCLLPPCKTVTSCLLQVLANCRFRIKWRHLCICDEYDGFWWRSLSFCAFQ